MDEMIHNLVVTNTLREPVIQSALQALRLPPGSRGLDAGCGVGHQIRLLAENVGPGGQVTGLDVSPEVIAYAKTTASVAGLENRVTFQLGDVYDLPFEDNKFDWAWSMDCVGYMPQDPFPALRELQRVVRPGGRVAILAWTAQTLLPGYPLLEARLNTTRVGLAPFHHGRKPGLHFLRALGWFQVLGFGSPESQTFAGSVYAPMSAEIRAGVEAVLLMRWPGAESELPVEDGTLFQRLCSPDSADYVLNQPDYCAFFTYTMFTGFVP